jgi:hypothetical protein
MKSVNYICCAEYRKQISHRRGNEKLATPTLKPNTGMPVKNFKEFSITEREDEFLDANCVYCESNNCLTAYFIKKLDY